MHQRWERLRTALQSSIQPAHTGAKLESGTIYGPGCIKALGAFQETNPQLPPFRPLCIPAMVSAYNPSSSISAGGNVKKALCVAVTYEDLAKKYPEAKYTLEASHHDAELVRNLLISACRLSIPSQCQAVLNRTIADQYGYEWDDITVLVDKENDNPDKRPTYKNLVRSSTSHSFRYGI